MSGSVPTWSTAIQFVVAGVVVGLCALQAGWLRGEGRDARGIRGALRTSRTSWLLGWSLALAAVSLLNGIVALVPAGAATDVVLLLRFVALAVAVTLSLPAVQAFTDGPDVRLLAAATATWYLAAGVLWVATDLVVTHRVVDGMPQYGPLATAVDLVPVVVLGLYVVQVVKVARLTTLGAVVTVAGFASAALLVASSIPPPSAFTELFKGVWALPLVVGLQVLSAHRITVVRREAARRSRMRDALATVTNAAWLSRTPQQVLDRAVAESRAVLGDETITGTTRPLAHGRHVAELLPATGRPTDQDAAAFLDDLARVVCGFAERQTLTDRLRTAALVDPLTALPNRAALDHHLEGALISGTAGGTPVAVLLLDLLGFRALNERHGHAWGDRLICHVADHLRRSVGDLGFVARAGADEFVVVLPDAPGTADLRATAVGWCDGLAPMDDRRGRAVLTVGVATWQPGDADGPDQLLRDAALAMREARRGHLPVAFFDDRLRAEVSGRETARSELERALADGEIVAHFQPLIDAMTLETVSLEVLARWQHEGALRPPSQWLPLAEETGLVLDVGREMFRQARVGMERFGLPVAVNVAARQLDEPDFVAHVERAWGTDSWDRLTIEVTESALLYDAQHVRTSLTELAARGVRIALDDFGTGYNSLSRLGELPLHVLKIDRTFVRDLASVEGTAVVRAILALAAAHGLEVVAEGVEHRSELAALVAMGVSTVQGHMLGRPSASPVRERRCAAPTQRGVAPELDHRLGAAVIA